MRGRRAEVLPFADTFPQARVGSNRETAKPSDPAHLPVRPRAGPLDDRPWAGKRRILRSRHRLSTHAGAGQGPIKRLDGYCATAKVPRLSSLRRVKWKTFARVRT